MKRLGLIALLLATIHGAASAQETTATITGVATDQSGAAVPGVSVTAKNLNTGASRTVVTNEIGLYTALQLPVGTYEVVFELAGFQTVTMRNIELHVNDRLKLDARLGVSGIAERAKSTNYRSTIATSCSSRHWHLASRATWATKSVSAWPAS